VLLIDCDRAHTVMPGGYLSRDTVQLACVDGDEPPEARRDARVELERRDLGDQDVRRDGQPGAQRDEHVIHEPGPGVRRHETDGISGPGNDHDLVHTFEARTVGHDLDCGCHRQLPELRGEPFDTPLVASTQFPREMGGDSQLLRDGAVADRRGVTDDSDSQRIPTRDAPMWCVSRHRHVFQAAHPGSNVPEDQRPDEHMNKTSPRTTHRRPLPRSIDRTPYRVSEVVSASAQPKGSRDSSR
jgi:hypothetical protein